MLFLLAKCFDDNTYSFLDAWTFNSLWLSDALWDIDLGQHWLNMLPDVTKPLPEPMLTYH